MDERRPTETIDGVYEPPQVESVLTAEELAREIQYAGVQTTFDAQTG